MVLIVRANTDNAAIATLVSSIFAFLVALLAAYLLDVPIDPVSMSEALPFLVITVGFDKPFLLAQAVFENPDIAPIAASPDASPIKENQALPNGDGSTLLGLDLGQLHKELAPLERLQRLAEGKGVRWAAPVAAKHIVSDAVRKKGVTIVRDYAIEIAVLSIGAASRIGGLREFCYLGQFTVLSYISLLMNSCPDHGCRLRLPLLLLRRPACRHGRGPPNQAHPRKVKEEQVDYANFQPGLSGIECFNPCSFYMGSIYLS